MKSSPRPAAPPPGAADPVRPAASNRFLAAVCRGNGNVAAALLFLLVFATYLPSLRNGFTNYDDEVYVTANDHVKGGLTLANLGAAFRSTENSGNWHPLTWVSHMLDCQVFGLRPWGHHLTSLLLHAVNTLLVFGVFRRLTGAAGRSLFVATLFGLHPLRVESVAWVAERKDVLSALFWLLTMWTYARYAQTAQSRPGRRALFYGLTLLFLAAGLMSKPMVVTLPFVLLLLDIWPLRRLPGVLGRAAETEGAIVLNPQPSTLNPQPPTLGSLVLEKLPFFALAAVASVLTYLIQSGRGDVFVGLPFTTRAANALVGFSLYLGKLIWPVNLSVLYPRPPHWPPGTVLWAGALVLGLTALALALRRRRPYLLIGWLWFLGTLVPVCGLFVQAGAQSIADRYSYLPFLGLFMALAWGAHDLTRSWRSQCVILAALVAAIIASCIALTRPQLIYWANGESLARHAIAVTRDNFIAHNNLGAALDAGGHLDQALLEYREAVSIQPDYRLGHENLAGALVRRGDLDAAIREYKIALDLNPRIATTHYRLAGAFERKGQLPEAVAEFQQALKLDPDYTEARSSLGVALGKLDRLDDAIAQFQEVLKRRPDSAEAHNNLGSALAIKGRLDDAIAQFREALRLKPDYPGAVTNLANAREDKAAKDQPRSAPPRR